MPSKKSKKVSSCIKRQVKKGVPQKQAVAIAMREAGVPKKKKGK